MFFPFPFLALVYLAGHPTIGGQGSMRSEKPAVLPSRGGAIKKLGRPVLRTATVMNGKDS